MHEYASNSTQPWLTEFSSRHAGDAVGMQVYGKAGRGAARPVVVYFHGGLFNCGNVGDAAPIASALSAENIVACVDYPLAPRLHFPATVEVAYEALQWAAAKAAEWGGDANRLFVAGDQAGGNLAAVVAMMARDRGMPRLRGQVLITPMLDPQQATRSMQDAADMPCRRGWREYLPCVSDAMHPYAAPCHSRRLGNLAPALIISSEQDPLRDEAEQYAGKLIAAGVPVQMRRLQTAPGRVVQPAHPEFTHVLQVVGQFVADAGSTISKL